MPMMSHPKYHFLDRFFPTPKFLALPAVGLAISDSAISALELVKGSSGYTLGRFGRRMLPMGSVTGGYVNNRDVVVEELRKLKVALHLDFVNASLPEEKAYLFKTQIPHVAEREIRGALEFKIEENVPLPAGEAIFDYVVITETGHETNNHLDVGMTVLPKKVVETYAELLSLADIVPLSFELEAQAIARALVPLGDSDTYLVVNLGEQKTGLFIVSEEVVRFTSTVAVGGAHITEAIAKHLSLSAEEAEKVKSEHTAFKHKKHEELFLSLINALSALKDEIVQLSVYWSTHKEQGETAPRKISKILLCGRDAGLTGLSEYFSTVLQGKVEVGNVWQNVFSLHDYVPSITLDESLDYATAVGLALSRGR